MFLFFLFSFFFSLLFYSKICYAEIPHPPESPKPTRVPTPPLPEPISEPITNGHIHKEPEPEPEPEQEQAPVPEPPKPEPTPPSHVTHSRACPGCQRDVQVSDDRLVALGMAGSAGSLSFSLFPFIPPTLRPLPLRSPFV